MTYLNRDERKQRIIDSAKQFVLTEGLNTLTIRKLAEKAAFSIGQVHHHFESIHDLKSQVFLELVHENLNLNCLDENASSKEKLIYLLGSEATSSETPYIRVWNDAESNVQSDPIFKEAYAEAIKIWKNSIIQILNLGFEKKEFIFQLDSVDEIAVRLICLAIGLEYLSNLPLENTRSDFFHHQILFAIHQELKN